MSHEVKCHITGETGTSDKFVKIGRYYYKSREIYEKAKKRKENETKLAAYIAETFLGYAKEQPPSPIIYKKLKDFSYYGVKTIYDTFEICAEDIRYWLEHKQFNSEWNKISYMFAIVKNAIADVQKKNVREIKQQRISAVKNREYTDFAEITGCHTKGKDLSSFLEDEDI